MEFRDIDCSDSYGCFVKGERMKVHVVTGVGVNTEIGNIYTGNFVRFFGMPESDLVYIQIEQKNQEGDEIYRLIPLKYVTSIQLMKDIPLLHDALFDNDPQTEIGYERKK